MVIRLLTLVSFVGLLSESEFCLADIWSSPKTREVVSEDGSHVLRLVPGKLGDPHASCLGELYSESDGVRSLVWSHRLLNRESPVEAHVASTGRYVVTMDDWHAIGTHPIVVYGPDGDQKETYELADLLVDSTSLIHTETSILWNENAIAFFGPQDLTFIVRLVTGRLVVVDLEANRVLTPQEVKGRSDAGESLVDFAKEESERIAIRRLDSSESDLLETGAILAGQLQIREAIPALRILLTNDDYYTRSAKRGYLNVFYVRKAAADALRALGEDPGPVVIEVNTRDYDPPRSI